MFLMIGDVKECVFSKVNEVEVVKNFRVELIKDVYKRRIKCMWIKLFIFFCKSRGYLNF